MLTLIVTEKGGSPKRMEFERDEVTVGRVPGNDIVLAKGNVSKRHSRVVKQDGRFFVVDLKSTNGTYLNGRRITTPSVIRPGDKIYIGDFVVMVDMGDNPNALAEDPGEPIDEGASAGTMDTPEPMAAVPQPQEDPNETQGFPQDEPEAAPPAFNPTPVAAPAAPPLPGARAPVMTSAGPGTPMLGGERSRGPGMPGKPSTPGIPAAGAPGAPPSASGPRATALGVAPPPAGRPPLPGSPLRASGPSLGSRGEPAGAPQNAPLGAPPLPSSGMGSLGAVGAGMGPGGPPGPGGMGGPGLGSPLGPRPVAATRDVGMGLGRDVAPEAPTMQRDQGPPPRSVAPQMPPLAATAMAPMEPAQAPPPPVFNPYGGATPATETPPEPAYARGGQDNLREVLPPLTTTPEPLPAPSPVSAPVAAAPPLGPRPLEFRPLENRAQEARPTEGPKAPPRAAPGAPAGEEYPESLAQVVRAARQRGAESTDRLGDDGVRQRARSVVEQAARASGALPPGVTLERITRDAVAELVGAGALETVLEDADVTSVLVEPTGRVLVGRAGPLGPSGQWFSSGQAVLDALDRLLRASGLERPAGESHLEATLADGHRVYALWPPASSGPVVSLERSGPRVSGLGDLTARAMLTGPAAALLAGALTARRNVVVVGPRGSGRSTLLAALVGAMPPSDRVVVVEARDEVARVRRDAIALKAEGDWTRALAAVSRFGAARVVYGEAVDAVARALTSNLTTGSEGWLVAVEAPTAEAGISRLCMVGTLGPWFEQADAVSRMASTRPVVVETARFGDGACRVTRIGEVRGVEGELFLEPLFAARVEGGDGAGLTVQLQGTGAAPSFGG